MRLAISLGLGLALVAGMASAQSHYSGFRPIGQTSAGFQRPANWSDAPPAPRSFSPPEAPRAYSAPKLPGATRTPGTDAQGYFKPLKPYTGVTLYSDEGGLDSYPRAPKRRKAGF